MTDFRHPQPLTTEQIELLESVKPSILEDSYMFDMGLVFYSCGTPACIAGHCAVKLGVDYDLMEVEEYFGMEDGGDMKLFYASFWDETLYERYRSSMSNSQQANLAIEAIDLYISNTREYFAQQAQQAQ